MSIIRKIQLATSVILLLCFLPMPYGFYMIVRIVTMFVCLFLMLGYYSVGKKELAATFGVIALLFQPIVKIALGRELWLLVDLVVAILLFVLALKKE